MRHKLTGKKRYNHKSAFADNAKFQFRALCKKYRLHISSSMVVATGKHWLSCRDFMYRPETHKSHFSAAMADRYARMLLKFIEDFRAGMFDYKFYSVDYWGRRPRWIVEKRTTPQVKICAKKLSHCPGGFYPGDCPKNWKECMLSAAAWDFKATQ